MSGARLEVRDLSKSFRGLKAVRNASFEVPAGEIVGLIGPNGAGKTTIFNLIAGVMAADSGTVTLDGHSLAGLRPDQVCRAGVGRTFQIVKPFAGLSVQRNVVIAALNLAPDIDAAERRAVEILDRLGLKPKRHQLAGALTLPERKRLEVARALATGPRLLLLDEVMAGLRPTEVDVMVGVFKELNASLGITILLIEHVMRAVMALSRHIVVLHHGEIIADGTPEAVTRHPKVLESYLGEEALG
ncbi:MAG: ABC transporter ATP-binding protein [Alphaproteobacteria bacterium]|nr:ABC transporter ATP-binding protein [Alphaproteobacteria bacterium]